MLTYYGLPLLRWAYLQACWLEDYLYAWLYTLGDIE